MSRIDELIRELCPDGVPRMPLGSLGSRNKGTAMTAAKMKTIGGGGPIRVFAAGNTIADVAEDAVPAKDVVRKPSIIVKSRGHIGFTFYERPFTHKAELWSYSIDQPGVDQKFVYYYLLTQVSKLQELARATSVKLPQLGVKDTDALLIPVPPLEAQREIVRVLDQFTQLEARRLQYAYYRESLFRSLSADAKAHRVRLGDFAALVRGNGMPKAVFTATGVPAIHYGHIYTRYGVWISTTQAYVSRDLAPKLAKVEPGDLVVTNTSENYDDVGKAVAWLGSTWAVTGGHATVVKHAENPTYLAHYFRTDEFARAKRRHATGTKVIDISARKLAQIEVPLPPRHVQDQIADILDKFDALVNDLSSGLPAEIAARRKQYEHYRDTLLTF